MGFLMALQHTMMMSDTMPIANMTESVIVIAIGTVIETEIVNAIETETESTE
jgi:hypothetical protein